VPARSRPRRPARQVLRRSRLGLRCRRWKPYKCVAFLVAAKVAEMGVAANCWGDYEGMVFSFAYCCRFYVAGVLGHPKCWHGGYTYEMCCLPDLHNELGKHMSLIPQATTIERLRELSGSLLDFHTHYAFPGQDEDAKAVSFQGFEKVAHALRRLFDEMPYRLSYFDVLFTGLGIQCEPSEATLVGGATAMDDYVRCCRRSSSQACMQIFEMLAIALGHQQRKALGGEDEYYRDFSEHWAFHHFTPSILRSSDVPEEPRTALADAFELDSDIAGALAAEGEPMLGIEWGALLRDFKSPKFCYGINFLTLLFKRLQASQAYEARPVEIFEVGAGYGSLPRIVAAAKQRLRRLSAPINVQRYVVLDRRSATDLQRWYLDKTLGSDRVHIADWATPGVTASWPEPETAPLRVDLVEHERRDQFVHEYSMAAAMDEADTASGASAAPTPATRSLPRPLRLLIAVNSWHEMPMTEFFWYYNAFVTGPSWQVAADWIFYVSNREWSGNDAKEQLLLGPGPRKQFDVRESQCSETNCLYLLQRMQ